MGTASSSLAQRSWTSKNGKPNCVCSSSHEREAELRVFLLPPARVEVGMGAGWWEEEHTQFRFLQPRPAFMDVEEREAELRVFLLPPARAHPDLDAAVADLVDGRGRLREERRGAEGHRRHQRPEPDP